LVEENKARFFKVGTKNGVFPGCLNTQFVTSGESISRYEKCIGFGCRNYDGLCYYAQPDLAVDLDTKSKIFHKLFLAFSVMADLTF